MRDSRARWVVAGCLLLIEIASGQISSFPYVEHFDTVTVPNLPVGWSASTNRLPTGDFVSSSSSPHSTPNCAYSANSTISQSIVSPAFNFTDRTPDKLQFYVARSSTHTSGLLVESSIDGGVTFPIALSDTIKNPGTTSYVLFTVSLPRSLTNQNGVKVRWRIVGGTGGSTATFRLDDVIVTTLVSYDVAVGGLSVFPTLPTSQDSLIVKTTVKNLSIQAATNYVVNFFCDLNNNSIPDESEKFAAITGPSIPVSDSVTIVAGHSALKSGNYRFFTIVSLPHDEQPANDTASTVVSVGYTKGSILVNEIMYAPSGDEPEWVELLNRSRDTVNMKNWRISDNNVSTRTLISGNDLLVAPGGYCIVAKDPNFSALHAGITAPVAIANFAALNNTTPDAVVIYEPRLTTIDSVFYIPTWGGQGGKTLERIDSDDPSTDQKNWGTSRDSSGSTPGKANSIIRLTNDLSLDRIYRLQADSGIGLNPVIICVIRNIGKSVVTSYSVSLYGDFDRDQLPDPNEFMAVLNSPGPINPQDSAMFSYTCQGLRAGECEIIAVVNFPQDERTENNRLSTFVSTRFAKQCIVINEIMFDPLDGQNEWIEYFNRSREVVDIKGWRFKDRPTASGAVNSFQIVGTSTSIQAGEFIVVAADSSILNLFTYLSSSQSGVHLIILNRSGGFGLGNDGDDIVLQDLTGATIDSVTYSPRWHRPDIASTKGRSLEKIHPDLDPNSATSWTTSVVSAGGTPGKLNSIYTLSTPSVSSISFTPNPFSPDGDGYEDFCLVQYNLPFTTALIHARIYDIKGRLVRTLANSQPSASHGELVWDGLSGDRQRVRIGPYIVLIEATEANGKGTTSMRGVVVVAARL